LSLKNKIRPGDIWIAEPPKAVGHEQEKERPYLILTKLDELELVSAIPLTSNIEAKRFPFSHLIKRSELNGLLLDSIALCFQITTLSFKRLKKKIGRLEEETFIQIKITLQQYLGLSSE